MPSPVVRAATAADVAAVREVADLAWRDTYAGLLRIETIEAFLERAYSIDQLRLRVDGECFLVSDEDGRIVGFVEARRGDDRVTLRALYARPASRGRGVGTALLEAVRARYPGLPVVADVLEGNRKGERFYERRGFVPRERREDDLAGERVVERRWWLDAR